MLVPDVSQPMKALPDASSQGSKEAESPPHQSRKKEATHISSVHIPLAKASHRSKPAVGRRVEKCNPAMCLEHGGPENS